MVLSCARRVARCLAVGPLIPALHALACGTGARGPLPHMHMAAPWLRHAALSLLLWPSRRTFIYVSSTSSPRLPPHPCLSPPSLSPPLPLSPQVLKVRPHLCLSNRLGETLSLRWAGACGSHLSPAAVATATAMATPLEAGRWRDPAVLPLQLPVALAQTQGDEALCFQVSECELPMGIKTGERCR